MKLYLINSGSSIHAMAIWPFILLNRRFRNKSIPPDLLTHERIHHRQQLEMLLLPFYFWYILEFVIRYARCGRKQQAYRQLSFEQEAYQHDRQLNYLKNRPFWAFLNYLK